MGTTILSFQNRVVIETLHNEGRSLRYIAKRQLLVCNIPNFARLFVMTSASICACNPTKLRA